MNELTLSFLALFIVLFLIVYFTLGIAIVAIKSLKMALNWLLPPLGDS